MFAMSPELRNQNPHPRVTTLADARLTLPGAHRRNKTGRDDAARQSVVPATRTTPSTAKALRQHDAAAVYPARPPGHSENPQNATAIASPTQAISSPHPRLIRCTLSVCSIPRPLPNLPSPTRAELHRSRAAAQGLYLRKMPENSAESVGFQRFGEAS
jgi:hypothetical protein